MHPAVAVILSYLSGSIPSASLAGKWSGVDLRAHGSGNLGATNVVRVLGPRIGLLVFAMDIAKGALPVRFLPPLTSPVMFVGSTPHTRTWLAIACGVAAIIGHIRPAFLGFRKGGKGVATACGVFLALAPIPALLSLLIFAVVLMASGFVSLGSLTAATSLPVLIASSLGMESPLFYVAVLTMIFVFWTHRANIQRLRSGTEYRFGRAANFGRRPSLMIGIALLVLAAAFLANRVGGTR
ncbi:MAG TPA: glycerol-3-phosphate 1-O-acyltransferase PlsY [Gemmatimonadaceae bacterium]|nr:glycerol-3-phosphate 1-O-acyltransferase PlsY [Gemmatimonadaceae bacterium]